VIKVRLIKKLFWVFSNTNKERRLKIIVSGLFAVSLFAPVSAQRPYPVIDVHLHAFPADAQGPPPLAMCKPMNPFPARDPLPALALP